MNSCRSCRGPGEGSPGAPSATLERTVPGTGGPGRDAPLSPEIIALSLLSEVAAWGWPGQCLDRLWPVGRGWRGRLGCSGTFFIIKA